MLLIPFHNIDPVIFYVSPWFSLNWYKLLYVTGVLFGLLLCDQMSRIYKLGFPKNIYIKSAFGILLTMILGARLVDVFLYDFDYYIQHPNEILITSNGGLSFHGGLIGVLVAAILYTRYHKINFTRFFDVIAVSTPMAVIFGRIANFINGELYGRVTDVAWAMPFPKGGGLPRHPSQLYEAFFEGIVLYVVMRVIYKYLHHKPGVVSGFFGVGYGVIRFFVEYYREPQALSWIKSDYLSGGQILCLMLMVIGIIWITVAWFASRQKNQLCKE